MSPTSQSPPKPRKPLIQRHTMVTCPTFLSPSVPPLRRARRAPKSVCPRCAHSSDGTNALSKPALLAQIRSAPQPESVVLRGIAHDMQLLAASQSLSAITELRAHIALLQRHKVALLLDDVACHIRCAAHTPISTVLLAIATRFDTLGAALLALPADADDGSLRAILRRLLWEARVALEPVAPTHWTRDALERARGALLDVAWHPTVQPAATADTLRSEVYALLIENTLLDELRSLRLLERAVRDTVLSIGLSGNEAVMALARAAADLGNDDYRVRGKTRVAEAVQSVREAVLAKYNEVPTDVEIVCDRLYRALLESLETDLVARRPEGQAMLLRPMIYDIPNFEVVSSHIVRGGQPTSRGVEWLRDYGVSTVVDLRGSDRGNQWAAPDVFSIGLNVGAIGGLTWCNVGIEDFGTPSFDQVEQFIDITNRVREKGGVCFVHCKAGIGRTGVMVSCWRIRHGESVDEALRKERLYSPDGGGLQQEDFVREYASRFSNRH